MWVRLFVSIDRIFHLVNLGYRVILCGKVVNRLGPVRTTTICNHRLILGLVSQTFSTGYRLSLTPLAVFQHISKKNLASRPDSDTAFFTMASATYGVSTWNFFLSYLTFSFFFFLLFFLS